MLGLGAILSRRWDYELVSFPGKGANRPQGQPSSLLGDQNHDRLSIEFPGQTGLLVLLCRQGKPQTAICSRDTVQGAVGWATQLPMCSKFLGWVGRRLYSAMGGVTNQLPCLGKEEEPAPIPESLFVDWTKFQGWQGSGLRTLTRHMYSPPSSLNSITILALQMREHTGLNYCLGTANRSSVCQDLNIGCCEPLPLPFSITIRFSVIEPLQILLQSHGMRVKQGLPRSNPQC